MESSTVKLLRKLIRSEVNRQLPRIMAEVYKDLKIELLEYSLKMRNTQVVPDSPSITSKPISEAGNRTINDLKDLYSKKATSVKFDGIKNPILKEVLLNTEGFSETETLDEVSVVPEGYVEGVEGKLVKVDKTVKAVMSNFMKDYRPLLKLADEKAEKFRNNPELANGDMGEY